LARQVLDDNAAAVDRNAFASAHDAGFAIAWVFPAPEQNRLTGSQLHADQLPAGHGEFSSFTKGSQSL
jgi:hypothetical protein